jgi:predicted transcriptional regulator
MRFVTIPGVRRRKKMVLPDATRKKIHKLSKQYGKPPYEIIKMAVDREYEESKKIAALVAKGKKNAQTGRSRRSA